MAFKIRFEAHWLQHLDHLVTLFAPGVLYIGEKSHHIIHIDKQIVCYSPHGEGTQDTTVNTAYIIGGREFGSAIFDNGEATVASLS